MRREKLPFRLDAQIFMEEALLSGKRSRYAFPIGWRNGRADISKKSRTSPALGKAVLKVRWSLEGDINNAIANLEIRCPEWDMPPRVLLLAGRCRPSKTFQWKFLCPTKRTLVQVVYFDPASGIFVGRAAFAEMTPLLGNRFERLFARALGLEQKIEALTNQPAPDKTAFTLLKILSDRANSDLLLATTGIYEAQYTGGLIDANKLLKNCALKRRKQMPLYYHNRKGILRERQLVANANY